MQNDRNCRAKRPLLHTCSLRFFAHKLRKSHKPRTINHLPLHTHTTQKTDRAIRFPFFSHSQRLNDANIVIALMVNNTDTSLSNSFFRHNIRVKTPPRSEQGKPKSWGITKKNHKKIIIIRSFFVSLYIDMLVFALLFKYRKAEASVFIHYYII